MNNRIIQRTYAIPAGIMASAFTEEIRKKREKKRNCPHCGKQLS